MKTRLEKHDSDKNLARYYRMSVLPNFFGEWTLQREWGRIGQGGRVRLEAVGVDFIEISGGNFEEPTAYQHTSKSGSTQIREAYFLDYAAAIKDALTIPLMVTGGFRFSNAMNDAIESGKTDLIGMGRPFIADPAFARKLLNGEISKAPAVEQDFSPAETLPRGAVLNWFCAQIALAGQTGAPDLAMSVVDGHESYLNQIKLATDRLLTARRE